MTLIRNFSLFLLPSVVQILLYVALLPVMTFVLDPADYGMAALVSAFSAFGTAIGSFGASYLIAAYYQIIDVGDRKKMISTIMIVGLTLSTAFSFCLLALWPIIRTLFPIFVDIPFVGLILSLLAMVLGLPWIFAYDIVVLDGKSKFYAVLLIIQCIISSLAMVLGLYVFKIGVLTLFIGPIFGNLVTSIGAIWYLRSYLGLCIHREWLSKLWKLGFVGVISYFAEIMQSFVEKSMLSIYVGFEKLGIYNHSQSYKSLAMVVMKASARTVWPITLSEAREIDGEFVQTKKIWDTVYVAITFIGIFLACLGQYIISILTHGKFTEAYVYATLWMILLLLQHIGKPHTGLLYATNQGAINAWIMVGATVLGILGLFILVPVFGLFGAVAAVFIQMILHRIGIQVRVNRFRKMPFQDWWAIIGMVIIIITLVVSKYFGFNLMQNIVLFFAVNAVFIIMSRQVVLRLASRLLCVLK